MRARAAYLGALAAVLASVSPGPAAGQDGLPQAVERARQAWLRHDVRALLASSDTVRLRIPGVAVSQAMRPGQATRLLERYLEATDEEGLALKEIRPVGEGHAYAELVRRHAVRGTDDRREETVFFGFRWVDKQWRLREVRVTP